MLLGIDIGTSSMKIAVYDVEGAQYYLNRGSYQPNYPQKGFAEMDPFVWWQTLVNLLASCPLALKSAIKAISFSGQMHGVILSDESAAPLYPAILWLDQRGVDECAHFSNDLLIEHGNEPYLGAMGVSLLWLQKHQLAIVKQSNHFLSPKDWLRAYLTGKFYTEPSDASGTLLTDLSGQWNESLITRLALDINKFPDIIASTEIVGTLLENCREALGLSKDVVVVMGGGDTACAAVGTGLHHHSNSMMLTIGTGVQLINVHHKLPRPKKGLNLFTLPSGCTPSLMWYQMAAMLNGGSVLEWVRTQFTMSWDEMYQEAFRENSDNSASDIVALPWLNGERSPWMDATLSAGWKNIKAYHTRSDMVYSMFRAVALSIRFGLEAFDDYDKVETITFAGGGSVQPLWRQLIANALNKQLNCLEDADLSVRGAALLAGLGSGLIKNDEKTSFKPRVSVTINPEPEVAKSLETHKEILFKEVVCPV